MDPQSPEPEPLVTVVIPTFNGGDWLLQTLASCQHQQPTSLEVIVVVDASTDDTPDRVAAAYPEVRLIRQPSNSGSGAHGRSTGLQLLDYVPSPAVEPSSLIRRTIALCGQRPFQGRVIFFSEEARW